MKGIFFGVVLFFLKIVCVFFVVGILIWEGYGFMEILFGLCFGCFCEGGVKIGCIGLILFGIKVIIDDIEGEYCVGEGEILVNGLNVMMGYYNKFEKIVEVFKEIEGVCWFKMGDIGKFVKGLLGEEFFKIMDWKKEFLKIFGGKYVVLVLIENCFKEEFLIE